MNIFSRLYQGNNDFEFIATRKRWYAVSAVLIVVCIVSFAVRGFNIGIDFKGGTQFQLNKVSGISTQQAVDALQSTGITSETPGQTVGSGSSKSILLQTKELQPDESTRVKTALESKLGLKDDDISVYSVSSTWGDEVTNKAVEALIIFLIAVFVYIAIRYQWRMAIGAIVALLHDLVIAAGVYSLVGFEVTPSTVVGLLTILGFSLYDTVVVFDKVSENSRDLSKTLTMTYSEAANHAVNQTLMRSINTSLISLLPVAGLLFVGAGLLGVGTIKDLALILFVGLAVGAYSSLFLATPIVVDLEERRSEFREVRRRVIQRRSTGKVAAESVAPGSETVRRGAGGPAPAPRPGARPQRKPR